MYKRITNCTSFNMCTCNLDINPKRRTVSKNFGRQIHRKLFGQEQNNIGSQRIQRNHIINNLIHGTDILSFKKSRRVVWLGYTMTMEQHLSLIHIQMCIRDRYTQSVEACLTSVVQTFKLKRAVLFISVFILCGY